MLYKRIPYGIKKAIRKYGTTHTLHDTAKYFSVSYASVVRIFNNPLPNNTPPDIEPQPQVCSKFGCGKKLSATEKLYGNKCINHSKLLII